MENRPFEEELSRMTKPEIPELKHASLLPGLMRRGRDGFVLSAWWLSIPLYILAMLAMQALYQPHFRPLHALHTLIHSRDWSFVVFFAVLPVVCGVANVLVLRRTWFLAGSPGWGSLVRIGWQQLLIILLCLFVFFVYL